MQGNVGGGDDGLLLESRRLLNALNEENSDLKETHYQLESRLREEEDAHNRTKRLMLAEQKDSKQINFNLMSQLKTKTTRVKELEAQLEEVIATDRTKAREAVRSQSATSDLQAEVYSLQEHLRIAEERNQSLSRQLADSESQATKFAGELQRAVAAHRDDQLHQQQDFNVTTVQLREELGNLREKASSEEGRATKAEETLTSIKEHHAAECQALVEEARRNAQVEADAMFAHDQMHHIASMVHQNLADLQSKVRVCASECEENDAQMHHLLQRCREESSSIRAVHQCNTSIEKAVNDQRSVFDTKLKDTLRELESAKFGKNEAEGKILHLKTAVDEIRREVADMERQIQGTTLETRELKQQNATLSAKLSNCEKDASSVAERSTGLKIQATEFESRYNMSQENVRILELELSKERASYTAQLARAQQIENELRGGLREEEDKCVAMQRAYEEELATVRGQLQDHTTVLSSALGRLQHPVGLGGATRSASAMMIDTPASGGLTGYRQPSQATRSVSQPTVGTSLPFQHHASTQQSFVHQQQQQQQQSTPTESGFLQTNHSSIHHSGAVTQPSVLSPTRAPPQPMLNTAAASPSPDRQLHVVGPTSNPPGSQGGPNPSPAGDPLENQLVAALKRLNA